MIPALFRGSLCLAAVAACAAAFALDGPSVWLWAVAGAAGLLAWRLWRTQHALAANAPDSDANSTMAPTLRVGHAQLQDLGLRIRQLATDAHSLDAALHEAASLLKSELGAVHARVYRVKPASHDTPAKPRLTELIVTRNGIRPTGETAATDGSVLAQAIRHQRAVLALPEAAAVPIVCNDAVVAALALSDLAIAVDGDALQELAAAIASTLGEIALREAPTPSPSAQADSEAQAADESQFRRDQNDGPLTPHPLRQGPPPTMLTRRSPPHAPATDPADAVTAGGDPSDASVLDAVALARLGELDPDGSSRLLPRVLTAYLSSVARLRPQLVAARTTGDFETIRHVTHTLKSSSASIGALKLAAICAQIDNLIRTEDTTSLDPHLDSMDAELERVLKAVKHLLGSYP